ncbi:Clp protease ClpP [Corynebacterium glucuronolyticum]|uniref:Clp protease ClpP n=1 Tax=Corynebacterium glucuronolyticum TaxID=39791 RepID=A0A7T4EHQ9_9CORY|nr:Clp protease ClpP [Corynebacterium glucuronolyticum]QQB47605.1 Clp protease ClpP [Corynebacterium glucuronolyticum]
MTVIVESLAASAASFIAVGGADEVLMRPSAEMMIHRAMTYMDGNADDARKTLEDLERQDKKLANIYAEKAGGTVEDWLTAMSAETWYAADEAVAAGLADGVLESKKQESAREPVAASMRRRFKFANRAAAPPPKIPSGVRGMSMMSPVMAERSQDGCLESACPGAGQEAGRSAKRALRLF